MHTSKPYTPTCPKCLIRQKTFDKYYIILKSFFKWCEDEGYIIKTPAPKTSTKTLIKKSNPKEARDSFSYEWLDKFFHTPIYTGYQSAARRANKGEVITQDAYFWIPLVALYTGMRPAEIIQLTAEDIRNDGGIAYFDVNPNDNKKIKTEGSARQIPIHGELIKIGFMEFVESRRKQGRLFSEVKYGEHGQVSDPYSKFFSRYMAKVGLKSKKLVFYSRVKKYDDQNYLIWDLFSQLSQFKNIEAIKQSLQPSVKHWFEKLLGKIEMDVFAFDAENYWHTWEETCDNILDPLRSCIFKFFMPVVL